MFARAITAEQLIEAVDNNDVDHLDTLLTYGADVNAQDAAQYSMTALHFAASIGHVEMATLLLDNDARVDIKDSAGKTPLDDAKRFAEQHGGARIYDLLQKHAPKQSPASVSKLGVYARSALASTTASAEGVNKTMELRNAKT